MQPHLNNWRVTIALFALTGVVESFAFGHLGAFTPLYLGDLGVPAHEIPRWTGILAALGFVLGIPLLPFWGAWADRYSRKLIIVRSAYAAAAMFALAALSGDVWQFAASRMLSGFVFGNTGVMLAVQADITPRQRLGSAIGLVAAGPPLGIALGPLFGGLVVQQFGVPFLLLIDAALTFAVALLLTMVLREEPRARRADVSVAALLRESVANLLTTPLIARLFVLSFVVLLGLSVALPYVPLVIERLWDGPRSTLPLVIGALASASGVAMALTTPLWGRAGDRLGHARVLSIGAFCTALALAAQAAAGSLPVFAAGRIGQGLVQGSMEATITALIALSAPMERRASILNLSRLPAQLSWFCGPVLGAALSPLGLPVVFAVAAGCALLGSITSLRLNVAGVDGLEGARVDGLER